MDPDLRPEACESSLGTIDSTADGLRLELVERPGPRVDRRTVTVKINHKYMRHRLYFPSAVCFSICVCERVSVPVHVSVCVCM